MSSVIIPSLLWGDFSKPAIASFQSRYPVLPGVNETPCYLHTRDGVILNLTQLCGVNVNKNLPLSKSDRTFLEEYQTLLRSSSTTNSQFSNLANTNPQQIIKRAKTVCNHLRQGNEIALEQLNQAGDGEAIRTLATEYYCREFND